MKYLSKNIYSFFSILLIAFCICYVQNNKISQHHNYMLAPLSDKDFSITTINSTL